MIVLGLDIGGANLKAADSAGRALQRPFALWRSPDRLAAELRLLIEPFLPVARLAVTMTGELCDCFATKADGVRHILDAVANAAGPAPWKAFGIDGTLLCPEEAREHPLAVAAANWLALAAFAGRFVPFRSGLVIDMGSTTTDIVRVFDGKPVPIERTDRGRLQTGELVYCGVRRTPLCALFGLSMAAEFFATTEDVYLVWGDLPEDPERTDTADGRPATIACAEARLARMECTDEPHYAFRIAEHARLLQVLAVAERLKRVAASLPDDCVYGIVLAGAGEFLLPEILKQAGLGAVPRVSLAERLGRETSVAACAHAVAVLAEEQA
jgi:probable H4MPT-linked C1 transfer pathway protein